MDSPISDCGSESGAGVGCAAFKDGEGDSYTGSPISDGGSESGAGVGCAIFARILAGGNCGSE